MNHKKIYQRIITFILSLFVLTSICSCGDSGSGTATSAQLNVERIERDGI